MAALFMSETSGQALVLHAVRLGGVLAKALLLVGLIVGEVTLEPLDMPLAMVTVTRFWAKHATRGTRATKTKVRWILVKNSPGKISARENIW
jgi:hypothetical protein